MYAKAMLVGLAFGAIAFGFGALRELVLRPRLGELRAHQIGTILVCVAVGLVAWLFVRAVQPTRGGPRLLAQGAYNPLPRAAAKP